MSWTLDGFDGKVALVTGAGRMRSIGRPIAVELARAGCHVVLTGTGRDPSMYPDDEKAAGWRDIESVADEVRALGVEVLTAVSDVSDVDAVAALGEQITDRFGRIDILVNNAGAARGDDRVPVTDLDPLLWRKVIDVNLTGSFLMSAEIGRRMVAAGNGGSIVNISSIAGKKLSPNTSAYAASKAGLQALTACMAQEVAASGIRGERHLPGDHRHVAHGRHRTRRAVGPVRADAHPPRARRHGRRHRRHRDVPVLRSGRVGHRPGVERGRRHRRPALRARR